MRYINVISETPNLKMSPSVLSKVDYKDLTMGIEFEFAFDTDRYLVNMYDKNIDDYQNNRQKILNGLNSDQDIYSIYDFASEYNLEYRYDYPTYQEVIDFKTEDRENINRWYREFINTTPANKKKMIIDLLDKDWFPYYEKKQIRTRLELGEDSTNYIKSIFKDLLIVDSSFYDEEEDLSNEISEEYIKYNDEILYLKNLLPSEENIFKFINIDDNYFDQIIKGYLAKKIEQKSNPSEILYNIFDEHMYIDVYDTYHSEPKHNRWVIEPDSSVSPNGVEFVSPPQPVMNSLNDMKFVFEKIKDHKYFYTNSTTGLHINIGTFRDISKIDLLKMMLFLGEDHVAQLFSRKHNKYAKTILEQLYFNSIGKEYYDILDQSNDFVIQYASEKYQSVNFGKLLDKGYLEIRILGGDYLNKQKEIITQINRFIAVINIACDPNSYREAYMKKLYTFKNNPKDVILHNILSDKEYYTLVNNISLPSRLSLDKYDFVKFLSSIDINKEIIPIIWKIIKNPVTYQIDNSYDFNKLSDDEIDNNKYLKYYLTLLNKYKQK